MTDIHWSCFSPPIFKISWKSGGSRMTERKKEMDLKSEGLGLFCHIGIL